LRHTGSALLVLVVATALVAGYLSTQTPVTLIVDGVSRRAGTHQTTVGAVLRDNDVALQPEDLVAPPPATLVTPGQTIEVRHAHHVTVRVDGRTLETRTQERQPLAILAGLDVRLGPSDLVIVDGELLPLAQGGNQSGLLLREGDQLAGLGYLPSGAPPPGNTAPPELIEIRRAVPLAVNDNGVLFTVQTTAATLGEALNQAGITLYLGDSVQPALDTRVSTGLSAEIRRSIPVTIDVDGHTVRTRTFRGSVGEVLAEAGIALVGDDYTVPSADSAITPDIHIQVVRVKEEILTEQESIPFDTVWQGDPTLEIDNQRVNQQGMPGVRQRRTRVRYENGLEVSRAIEDEWVVEEPATEIDVYGTQIVVRTMDTPEGPIEYWRVIPVLATSYSASTAGTSKNSPWYGRTATGLPMRRGIVAVDPRIIPLFTQLYIPGYGIGLAADTGSAIKYRRVDLGYDDDNLVLWYSWTQVYVLTPVPDPSRIQYVLGP
jgi:uncharacterized protein YabE (DUF348 family)